VGGSSARQLSEGVIALLQHLQAAT